MEKTVSEQWKSLLRRSAVFLIMLIMLGVIKAYHITLPDLAGEFFAFLLMVAGVMVILAAKNL